MSSVVWLAMDERRGRRDRQRIRQVRNHVLAPLPYPASARHHSTLIFRNDFDLLMRLLCARSFLRHRTCSEQSHHIFARERNTRHTLIKSKRSQRDLCPRYDSRESGKQHSTSVAQPLQLASTATVRHDVRSEREKWYTTRAAQGRGYQKKRL